VGDKNAKETGSYFITTRYERISIYRPGCRWEGNIKMDLGEIEFGMWIGLLWLRIGTGGRLFSNMVMILRVL
jgi:hypothetical protein